MTRSARRGAFEAFQRASYRAAFRELRRDLDKLPVRAVLKFTGGAAEQAAGKTLVLPASPRPGGGPWLPTGRPRPRSWPGSAAEDLETLDTLITVGIASSPRGTRVRWALARIRERPRLRTSSAPRTPRRSRN